MAKEFICPNPNCNYKGPARLVPRGNFATGCLLSFFFLIPGIIYFIVMQGFRAYCPKCGLEVRVEK